MTNLEGEPARLNKEPNRAIQVIRRLLGRQAAYQSDRVTGNAVPDIFTPQGIKDIESVPVSPDGRSFRIHASYDASEFSEMRDNSPFSVYMEQIEIIESIVREGASDLHINLPGLSTAAHAFLRTDYGKQQALSWIDTYQSSVDALRIALKKNPHPTMNQAMREYEFLVGRIIEKFISNINTLAAIT